MATKHAIEKARTHTVGIAMARNHNDAGSFFTYTSLALEQDMFAMATNNSLPLVSPWEGMENKLSGAPFCAVTPGGEEPPLLTDIACIEAHDGNISEATLNHQKLSGEYLVDPQSGELTDDPAPRDRIRSVQRDRLRRRRMDRHQP
jgi:L-2-hydroxycarboxylate dehydrogenase (NAD+)